MAGLEAEEEGLRKRMGEIDADSASIIDWLGSRGDKRKLLQSLIERIDVYVGKVVEIKWKFRDRLLI